MNEDTPTSACQRNGDSANGKPDQKNDIREVANGVYTRQVSTNGDAAHLSPSLWQDREEPAFELKFPLDAAKAREIAAWAAAHLNIDPHCRPELDYAYHIHGLYFDTPGLDVFHRSPGYKRKKYRLRRYGTAQLIFLEQKRK